MAIKISAGRADQAGYYRMAAARTVDWFAELRCDTVKRQQRCSEGDLAAI